MSNILTKYITLRQNISLSRGEFDSYRFDLLKKQLLYSYQNIPYYKMTFDSANVNPANFKLFKDLSSYPVITKDIIRLNIPDLVNHKTLFHKRLKSHTSGSTGQPMWTYYDLKSWIRKKYLIKARTRMECGLKPFDKIGIFEAVSQNSYENANILFRTMKSHYKVFSIFASYENTVQKLNSFCPVALYGAPSFFFQLGQFIKNNNIKFTSIKKIFTSSEYLQDNVRDYIKEIFYADVYDIYGSTEFKEVAWECEKHEGYHINEDEVVVEILNDGKNVSPGVIGNIVITDLRNKAMPLIRYQLNDKGMLINHKCSCGRIFSMMKPLAGRSSEYIILPNGESVSPFLFTTSIEKIDGLLQYQIVQTSKEKILVKVVINNNNFEIIGNTIKNILLSITNHLMKIDVEQKTEIYVEDNGKFLVVKNLLLEEKETQYDE
jgi:phenylacetate-coenzyme A ligase PaaK-like adenylate-forming protein